MLLFVSSSTLKGRYCYDPDPLPGSGLDCVADLLTLGETLSATYLHHLPLLWVDRGQVKV